MPTSRKRKGAKKRATLSSPAVVEERSQWRLKLDVAKLVYLKSDPDFLTMIKIGRVVNAVSYALTEVINYTDDNSVVGKRQYRRSCLVLSGYLHQAITLVLSIKGRYLTHPGFEPLRVLVLDFEHKKTRDYVRKIRNFTAFHLDEGSENELTMKTLSRLKLKNYTLMSGDDKAEVPFYFDLADDIDTEFLINEFSKGRDREATRIDILQSTLNYSYEFLNACTEFEFALGEKIDIRKYLY
jgi:hypothetical protein